MAVTNCPVEMVGEATRFCNESHGWDEPYMGNCSSLVFADLKQVVSKQLSYVADDCSTNFMMHVKC